MMFDKDDWACSIIGRQMLEERIGRFLRTHRDGHMQLERLLDSVPPDRTEAQYLEEREQALAAHEALTERALIAAMRRGALIPEDAPFVRGEIEHASGERDLQPTDSPQLRNLDRIRRLYKLLYLPPPEPANGERTRSYRARLLAGLTGCGLWRSFDVQRIEAYPTDRLDALEEEILQDAEAHVARHLEALASWQAGYRQRRALWGLASERTEILG